MKDMMITRVYVPEGRGFPAHYETLIHEKELSDVAEPYLTMIKRAWGMKQNSDSHASPHP